MTPSSSKPCAKWTPLGILARSLSLSGIISPLPFTINWLHTNSPFCFPVCFLRKCTLLFLPHFVIPIIQRSLYLNIPRMPRNLRQIGDIYYLLRQIPCNLSDKLILFIRILTRWTHLRQIL